MQPDSYEKPTDRQILELLGARIDRGEKITSEEKHQTSDSSKSPRIRESFNSRSMAAGPNSRL